MIIEKKDNTSFEINLSDIDYMYFQIEDTDNTLYGMNFCANFEEQISSDQDWNMAETYMLEVTVSE